MIFEKITIENFGLFKGKHTLDLNPSVIEGKNIIVVSGQNGVGKSTLLESIHLCLLGSLAINSRLSEENYEEYLFKRTYRNGPIAIQETRLRLTLSFIKSGKAIKYDVIRKWRNEKSNINEDVIVYENEKELIDLNKKEKNLFLRELIQPGLAKIIFFDGEKLSSLFESDNLTSFISESCCYLFGLNFIDLLKIDLGYLSNRLLTRNNTSQAEIELKKLENNIDTINTENEKFISEQNAILQKVDQVKNLIALKEEEMSKQGRWATKKLDKLKKDRQQLESTIQTVRKDLIELYGSLAPFVFCKKLCLSLKSRLLTERNIEKWEHSKDLLTQKALQIESLLKDNSFLKKISLDKKSGIKLSSEFKTLLLSKPANFTGEDTIHHQLSDTDRTKVIGWIDAIAEHVSSQLKSKSEILSYSEDQLKLINKEQGTFSKEDVIQPMIKELQILNKEVGAAEQKLESINRKLEELEKRKQNFEKGLSLVHLTLSRTTEETRKLKLAEKTKIVLEEYSNKLITRKLELLEKSVLDKFNLMCRKQQYLDAVKIDPFTFDIKLSKRKIQIEHTLLSAGEKQLLILAFLWGLRELTNISLPLIIDTPLARLDAEHRRSFLTKFLPAIQPQIILIGTELEINSSVLEEIQTHIVHNYKFGYDKSINGTQVEELTELPKRIAV